MPVYCNVMPGMLYLSNTFYFTVRGFWFMRSFEEYRQLAIDILRPSQRDLEHGLELHKNSFVFDAYGFMPRNSTCPDMTGLITSGASRDELNWRSEEFSMNSAFNDPAMVQKLKDAWEFAGVDVIFQNSGMEGNDIEVFLRRMSCYTHIVDKLPEIYDRAVFPHQLTEIWKRGKKALYMTTNGVPLSCKYTSVADQLMYIEIFAKLGIRMMHLTSNRRNLIGDGCAEGANAGLSDFGKQVIAEMNRVGVIPDCAHSGLQTSYDAAKCSTKPVVASHAVAGGLSTHYRSKTDEVIQAIKETGGYVGICAHAPFLQHEMNIKTFIDHIDYVTRKFGVDHVAIGTDHGISLGAGVSAYKPNPTRPIWESYWRKPGAGIAPEMKDGHDSMSWINWPMFTVGLVQRGYTDDEIRKIIGGNVLRVCEETLA